MGVKLKRLHVTMYLDLLGKRAWKVETLFLTVFLLSWKFETLCINNCNSDVGSMVVVVVIALPRC